MRRLVEYVAESKHLVALCLLLIVVEFLPCMAYFHDLYIQIYVVPHEPPADYSLAESLQSSMVYSHNPMDIIDYGRYFNDTPYAKLALAHLKDLPHSDINESNIAVAMALIRQQACVAAWNGVIKNVLRKNGVAENSDLAAMRPWPVERIYEHKKTYFQFVFRSRELVEKRDLCGRYLVPEGDTDAGKIASFREISVLTGHLKIFQDLGMRVYNELHEANGNQPDEQSREVLDTSIIAEATSFSHDLRLKHPLILWNCNQSLDCA